MKLKVILAKKLKTFLKESFTGSVVTNDLEPGLIKYEIKRSLQRPFKLAVFIITVDIAPEDVLYYCEQYYLERDWLKLSGKTVDINHNGLDDFFERNGENLFLALTPLGDSRIQITIVNFGLKNKYMIGLGIDSSITLYRKAPLFSSVLFLLKKYPAASDGANSQIPFLRLPFDYAEDKCEGPREIKGQGCFFIFDLTSIGIFLYGCCSVVRIFGSVGMVVTVIIRPLVQYLFRFWVLN